MRVFDSRLAISSSRGLAFCLPLPFEEDATGGGGGEFWAGRADEDTGGGISKIEKKKNLKPDKIKFDKSKSYNPDFYLPDYDIYLEHFGLDEDYRALWLSKKEEEKYLKERKRKLDLFI